MRASAPGSRTSPGSLRESLVYAPVELAFGTSGLRGLVRDITQLEAYINTKAFLEVLLRQNRIRAGDGVCLAGDLRPSTDRRVPEQEGRGEILQAVATAVADLGLRVVHLGRIPTPALMHYAVARGQASIMVTGSHIPFDRNGIKFNRPDGEVLKTDEAAILERVRAVRAEEYGRPAAGSAFDEHGMLRPGRACVLPEADPAGAREYLERYRRAFPAGALGSRRLLVYQHSAVGRDLLVEALESLGAKVTAAGRSDTFVPVDTEAVQPAMIEAIQQLVDAHGGAEIEAVVSTDGDSDRPLVLGVEDGRVRFFPGDLLGLVVAEYLEVRHVAVPVSANDAVDHWCAARGIELVKTRIGSPHVIAAMREVGWEANGGFLTATPLRVPGGGELGALPTRDAFLPILAALSASLGRGLSLGQLFARLPARFGKSDLMRPFPREISLGILARFRPTDERVEQIDFTEDGLRLRTAGGLAAGAEVSKDLAGELERIRRDLEGHFPAAQGSGRVVWINYVDGVRMGFARGDVVHLRPSGNAPELRVYANADTQARADLLVGMLIADGGVVRRMENEWRREQALAVYRAQPVVARLQGTVQHYAWGGREFLPRLLGWEQPVSRPWAEYWLGAHPSGPATVDLGGVPVLLPELVAAEPARVLGADVVRRFGPQLPYLLKVLDAREMLSIQAHPTRAQAEAGFARENAARLALDAPQRNYKDPHPKPEVHVALTEFWMLHGFRPLEEIEKVWETVPELRALMPDLAERRKVVGDDPASGQALLRELYERAMTLPREAIDTLLAPLIRRLASAGEWTKERPEYWALRAARSLPLPGGHFDRGLISIFLLNLVRLAPGEGTFQPAGTLHAYLEGANVELMASSDNVLRGGLTPKHVDVAELLRVVRFESGRPPILRGKPVSAVEAVFESPAEEFELSRIVLAGGQSCALPEATGAECLLALEGEAAACGGDVSLRLRPGQSVLVPAGAALTLTGAGPSTVIFRARVAPGSQGRASRA